MTESEGPETGDEDFKAPGSSEWGEIFANAEQARNQAEAEASAEAVRTKTPVELTQRAYYIWNEMGNSAPALIEALKYRPETVRDHYEGYTDDDLRDLGGVLEVIAGQEMLGRRAA